MKCNKCGLEFSPKIYKIHIKMCKGFENPKMTEKEIRAKAKELGIKSWHNKNIDRLKEEISEVV